MDLRLDRQVALIAGSSRGIGRAIADALLAEGACVAITGRHAGSLESALDEMRSPATSDRLLAIAGDLTDPDAVADAYRRVHAHFGRIDHIVANLGTGRGQGDWNPAESEWARLFDHNFFAAMRLTQAGLPYLFGNESGGSVLYISSIVGIEASGAPLPYSAAKAALLNYSKNLSRRVSAQKIRVNAICPGNVCFPGGSWQRRVDEDPDAVAAMLRREVPQQRFGTPAEIASLAVFLCSSQAAFCTGGCYVIDGGQTRSV